MKLDAKSQLGKAANNPLDVPTDERPQRMFLSDGTIQPLAQRFWTAVAERRGDTAFGMGSQLPKRRGASLPAAVQKGFVATSRLGASVLIPVLLLAFLVLTPGCVEKESDFQPLSGGFGIATKWVGIDSGPGAELFQRQQIKANANPAISWHSRS
jgi:hypothetical protein